MTSEVIDICVCTYRRPSLTTTLESIAAQDLPADVQLRVIVADNDETDVRRESIVSHAKELGLDLLYVHAPSRNISIARNACLAASTARRFAFIDDDEEASPDWIANLIGGMATADIVFGVSQARYKEVGLPSWIIKGDFHSNRISGNDAPWNGYTANVMINREVVAQHGLTFAVALGQVGGEDTLFFYQAYRQGARFAYAPQAVVFEDTPLKRATLGWLLRRRFRSGQIHFMIVRLNGINRIRGLLTALAKVLYCFGGAAINLFDQVRCADYALRGALHMGVAASALGFSHYREYGNVRVG